MDPRISLPPWSRAVRSSIKPSSVAVLYRNMSTETGQHRLPITIIPRSAIGGNNPSPVQIIVSAVVISVVMSSVTIPVVPSMVVIGGRWRRNKAGDSEHNCEHLRKELFHKSGRDC
jgi:hypothetical protein